MKSHTRRSALLVTLFGWVSIGTTLAATDPPTTTALVRAMQHGGYVLVMRHASSPREVPDAGSAAPGNEMRERQLDKNGIESATRMGAALKRLKVRVGEVWSSPTFRARQTVSYAALPAPTLAEELGDGGRSMSAAESSQITWLRSKASLPPRRGTNSLLVTHFPNIRSAFGDAASELADGEALIFHPDGSGQARIVGRIKIEDWPTLLQ